MSVVEAASGAEPNPSSSALALVWRGSRLHMPRVERSWAAPTVFAIANAVAFVVIAPGVPDIWAASARASAVGDGVGLTYWFSWFGGAAVPATYSVVVPFLSHLVGVRTLAAVSAILCTPLAWCAMRRSRRVELATWVATVLVAANLWSGRVPFLFGTMVAIAALWALRRGRVGWTVVLSVLSALGSPVAGAFLALALIGIMIAEPDRRRACLPAVAAVAASVVAVAVLFGTPGPQRFTVVDLVSCALPLAVYLLVGPPLALRTTTALGLVACPLLFVVPNGMGSNFQRFAWYCVPPVVVAYGRRRLVVVLLALAPIAIFSAIRTGTDVLVAASPYSSPSWYRSLVSELDHLGPALGAQRLEVVDDGTHAADALLIDHAMLARGWESQADAQLNAILESPQLDASSYHGWLRDNAVGFVAISYRQRAPSYEYALVANRTPGYLHEIWHDTSWTLYRVAGSQLIVDPPARVVRFSQARLVLEVPCACRFTVHVHWSRYLTASAEQHRSTAGAPVLRADDTGWTVVRTAAPGTYTLSGSLSGLFG